jgi:hypothetical protein
VALEEWEKKLLTKEKELVDQQKHTDWEDSMEELG